MTDAAQLFAEGHIDAAISAQVAVVKRAPGDAGARSLLFGLLLFKGDLERAATHIETIASALSEKGVALGALAYRACLQAENERQAIHRGASRPLLPPDAPAFLDHRVTAVHAAAAGDLAAAAAALAQADSGEDPPTASINGAAPGPISDGDEFLGPVLEVYASGRCLWLPLNDVRRLEVREPESVLDLFWARARLTRRDGNTSEVHLPTLYAGSATHGNDQVRLGRMTEWSAVGEVGLRGHGQKLLIQDVGDAVEETGLLEVRSLEVAGGGRGGTGGDS